MALERETAQPEAPAGLEALTPVAVRQTTLSPWEGAAFMATGAALLLHIVVDVPLWLSVLTAFAVAVPVLTVAARRRSSGRAGQASPVLRTGALAAAGALVAYDLSRLVVTTVFDYEVGPFEALPHFGAGIVGSSAPLTLRWVVGAGFHVANAITFGIAYTVWAGRRGIVAGVLFGLGLEAAMLGLYPAWLQIPNIREFASMSVVGHVAYGAALGYLAQWGLGRLDRLDRPAGEGSGR